jgi:hypothetical protein
VSAFFDLGEIWLDAAEVRGIRRQEEKVMASIRGWGGGNHGALQRTQIDGGHP